MELEPVKSTILSSLTTQPKMFIFDMSFGFLFLLGGLIMLLKIRDKGYGYPLLVGGTLYIFFAVLWHVPLEWDIY